MSVIVLVLFSIILFILGLATKASGKYDEWHIAGRSLGTPGLLATMAASNFSAFTIFGLSGAGYRMGWAYYPAMGFGTGLMAISFILLGIPLRRMSQRFQWITPAQFVKARYNSGFLAIIFTLLMLFFTLPYLATQAQAAGGMIYNLTGLPPFVGSAFLLMIIGLYVWRGGMRSIIRTDALQLLMLAGFSFAAFIICRKYLAKAAVIAPELMARNGNNNSFPMEAYAGTILMWMLADPMFPQLFQRFYAAREDRVLVKTASLYPLVTGILFFVTIGIGIAGRGALPGLDNPESDQIFTLLLVKIVGPVWASILGIAGLAALISTMDSQLLTSSSMIDNDFLQKKTGSRKGIIIISLIILAWLTSLIPSNTILDFLGSTAFPGYAALSVVVVAGLYCPAVGKHAAIASLLAGEVLVLAEAIGFRPVINAILFNTIIQIVILVIFTFIFDKNEKPGTDIQNPFEIIKPPAFIAIITIVILSFDMWNYNLERKIMFLGVPGFVWYSLGLCLLLSLAFRFSGGRKGIRESPEAQEGSESDR